MCTKRQIDREAGGHVLPRLELDFHDFSVAVGDSHTGDSSFVKPFARVADSKRRCGVVAS